MKIENGFLVIFNRCADASLGARNFLRAVAPGDAVAAEFLAGDNGLQVRVGQEDGRAAAERRLNRKRSIFVCVEKFAPAKEVSDFFRRL